jgi:3-carboxy-cis,cis-muconate cycloisomerase
MAGRTLTQHSTPIAFGAKVAGWLSGLLDARDRLGAARLPAQLAGASGNLASFVELSDPGTAAGLPAAFAARLGLDAPDHPWHTQRGAVTALGDALTSVTDALGVIASTVALLARPEIAELSEPTAAGRGGSSAMPQKQNPVLSVLIRSAAQRAPFLAAQLHASAAGAIDERPDGAWHAEWPALRELLRLTLGASALTAELVAGLGVDPGRMRANLGITGSDILAEWVSLSGIAGEPDDYLGVSGAIIDSAIARARS